MVKVSQRFVSQAIINRVTFGSLNQKKYITVHQTGNTNRGANAEMHARLQENGNSRQASWHYQVDDKEAIQSFPHDISCWHCGDGRGDGNMHSIGVEICINSDGDYKKAVENGARLVRQIMEKEGIPIQNVKQHYDWSRKNCPAQLRANKDGISWDDFKAMVQAEMEGKPAPKPSSQPKPSKPTQSVYTGNSIVAYLNSIGQPSSFSARAELAKDKGITNYRGTAEQNLRLLNMLRSEGNAQAVEPSATPNPEPKLTARQVAEQIYRGQGDWGNNPGRKQKVIERGYSWSEVQGIVNQLARGQSAAKPKKSIDQMAREIIAGQHGNGHANRRRSLGISQAEYDKVRRRVNQLA